MQKAAQEILWAEQRSQHQCRVLLRRGILSGCYPPPPDPTPQPSKEDIYSVQMVVLRHRLTLIDDILTNNAISDVPPTPVQSSCDLDAVVQPHPQNKDAPVKAHSASHSGDIRPRPPSGEPPLCRGRSGDVRMSSGDPHTRSDWKINKWHGIVC